MSGLKVCFAGELNAVIISGCANIHDILVFAFDYKGHPLRLSYFLAVCSALVGWGERSSACGYNEPQICGRVG